MRSIQSALAGLLMAVSLSACHTYTKPDAPIQEVSFTQVHLDDDFWKPRVEINRTVSIPSATAPYLFPLPFGNARRTDVSITLPLPAD